MEQEKKHRFCVHYPNNGPIMMVVLSEEEYQILKNIQREEKLPGYLAIKKMRETLKKKQAE